MLREWFVMFLIVECVVIISVGWYLFDVGVKIVVFIFVVGIVVELKVLCGMFFLFGVWRKVFVVFVIGLKDFWLFLFVLRYDLRVGLIIFRLDVGVFGGNNLLFVLRLLNKWFL